jgi:hypothetical protein
MVGFLVVYVVSDPLGNTFQQVSEPDPVQAEAFRLLGL